MFLTHCPAGYFDHLYSSSEESTLIVNSVHDVLLSPELPSFQWLSLLFLEVKEHLKYVSLSLFKDTGGDFIFIFSSLGDL